MTKGILAAVALLLPVAPRAAGDLTADLSAGTFQLVGESALGFRTGSTTMKFDAPGAPETSSDLTEYGLDVAGLYYLVPDVGLGLSVSFDRSTEETAGVEERTWTVTVGPELSVQKAVAERVAVFGRGMVGYATARMSGTGEPDLSATGFGVGLQAGVRYFVVKQVSIDAALTYTYVKLTTDEVTTPTGTIPELEARSSSFGFGAGVSVFFGR